MISLYDFPLVVHDMVNTKKTVEVDCTRFDKETNDCCMMTPVMFQQIQKKNKKDQILISLKVTEVSETQLNTMLSNQFIRNFNLYLVYTFVSIRQG